MRSTHSTQLAAAKAIRDAREVMVAEWAAWLDERTGIGSIPSPLVERELRLVIDTLIEMLGPLRREANLVWDRVMEQYGRTAATRGLAAGEVVDEIQHLRLLLIRHIGTVVASMRPRRAVAVFIRLNAVVDRAVAQAVVGYTDALVASLMMTDRQAHPITDATPQVIEQRLASLEAELADVAARR